MIRSLGVFVFLSWFLVGIANSATFIPSGNYPDEILAEMGTNRFQKINLQNKPLAFSSDGKLFDPEKASDFVSSVLGHSGDCIKILDLSLNRLPEDSLEFFLPLLRLPQFEFIDVTVNSGADSLDALGILSEKMLPTEDKASLFEKIIWINERWLDGTGPASRLPERYKAKHRAYYEQKGMSRGFTLPA